MPSISSGGNATGTFGYQDSINIQAAEGYARFECPVGTVVAEFSGQRNFGPYDGLGWKVTSLKGALYYEVADGTINYYSGGRDITSLVSGGGNFDATDAGSDWTAAPASLGVQATLTAGTSTTVLVETRDASDVVSTAGVITADTVSEVLRQTIFLTNAKQYRLRRSSGTGTVNLLIQR